MDIFYSLPNYPYLHEGWGGSKLYQPVVGVVGTSKIVCKKICTRSSEASDFSNELAAAMNIARATGSMDGLLKYKDNVAETDKEWETFTNIVLPKDVSRQSGRKNANANSKTQNESEDDNGED